MTVVSLATQPNSSCVAPQHAPCSSAGGDQHLPQRTVSSLHLVSRPIVCAQVRNDTYSTDSEAGNSATGSGPLSDAPDAEAAQARPGPTQQPSRLGLPAADEPAPSDRPVTPGTGRTSHDNALFGVARDQGEAAEGAHGSSLAERHGGSPALVHTPRAADQNPLYEASGTEVQPGVAAHVGPPPEEDRGERAGRLPRAHPASSTACSPQPKCLHASPACLVQERCMQTAGTLPGFQSRVQLDPF